MQLSCRLQKSRILALVLASMLTISSYGLISAASGGGLAAAATKATPILIGTESATGTAYDNNNDRLATMAAAIRAINKAGGIHGRPLKLIYCNSEHDPNQELACARQLVGDHITVMIGSEAYNPSVLPYLLASKIADVDTEPVSVEYTSPDSFLLTGGATYQAAAVVLEAAKQGLKKLVVVAGTGSEYPGVAQTVASKVGLTMEPTVYVTTSQTSFDPTAAQVISSGADAVLLILAPQQDVSIADAILAQGGNPTFLFNGDVPAPKDFDEITNIASDKVLVAGDTPVASSKQFPGIVQFDKEIAAENRAGDAEATPHNFRTSAYRAWLSVHMFAEIASTLKTVNNVTVLNAYRTAHNVNGLGLIPPWSPNVKGCYTGYPRVSNPYEWFLKYTGGQYVLANNSEKAVNMDKYLC